MKFSFVFIIICLFSYSLQNFLEDNDGEKIIIQNSRSDYDDRDYYDNIHQEPNELSEGDDNEEVDLNKEKASSQDSKLISNEVVAHQHSKSDFIDSDDYDMYQGENELSYDEE